MKDNLEALEKRKVNFIVAAKLKTMKKNIKQEITNDVDLALKKNPELENWTKDYTFEGRRLIVSYTKKRANKDEKDRARLVERIKGKMKDGKVLLADLINNKESKKYLKIERKGSKEAILNESKIEEHKSWHGIHGVITNEDDNGLNSEQILKRYRNLWQIEAAFRMNKHDLKMRPIYHWTEKRIRSHILICFVAYTLASYVKYKLDKLNMNLNFEEIKDELNRVQARIVEDKKSGKKFILQSKLTANQKKIYNAFNLKIDQQVRSLES